MQTAHLYQTLEVDLTNIDPDISPFWNKQSTELSSILWLPHQIESPELDSDSLNGLSNYQVDESQFWKKQVSQVKNLIQKHSLLSLPALSIRTTENEATEEVKGSQKIRVYPDDESKWISALNVFRRAYNISIDLFKEKSFGTFIKGKYKNFKWIDDIYGVKPSSEIRSMVVEQMKFECDYYGIPYDVNLIQSAYRKAEQTRSRILSERKNGNKSSFHLMRRNDAKQYMVCPRLTSNKEVYPRLLGKFHTAENIEDYAIGRTVVITLSNNCWHVHCIEPIEVSSKKVCDLKVIALDPGVRTFQTGFSETNVYSYGEKFVEEKLTPLMLELDYCISEKDKLFELTKSRNDDVQWINDRITYYNDRIKSLRNRKNNLVEDLHKRVAFDLVNSYDVILLPKFEVKQMVQKSNESRKRFINRKTVRSMLDLGHYKFKLMLKWFAKKYGKTVIDVNESYTSKTLWDGTMLNNLGGKATIRHQSKVVNRDHNGARNIFIRFYTKMLEYLAYKGCLHLSHNQNLVILAV